jgi:hypothetical protein
MFRKYAIQLSKTVSVGVISPYKEKITLLLHLEESAKGPGSLEVRVTTMNGFQGQQCDVIIFSTVRANEPGNIGFLNDYRRLNVAITRPKYSLVIICHYSTLSHDPMWRSLLEYSTMHGILYNHSNNTTLKAIARDFKTADLRYKSVLTRSESSSASANTNGVFESAPWEVILSSDFKSSMQKLPSDHKECIVQRIVAIAHGEWAQA